MKKGFTLTEVCITVGVIGLIAATTIPTMINRANQKTIIEGLKKVAATLNQAVYNATITNGGLDNWNWSANDSATIIMRNIIGPRLSVAYMCGVTPGNNPHCDYEISDLTGGTADLSNFEASSRVLLNDGMLIAFGNLSGSGANPCLWGANPKAVCGVFLVDTNGNKRPNTIGKDVFYYSIHLNGSVLPYGASEDDDYIDDNCKEGSEGMTCAAKLAKDGWEPKKCEAGAANCTNYPVTF